MKNYVVADRYGYWLSQEASCSREAVRFASGLSSEANLDYASCSYIGVFGVDISEKEIAIHNCNVAWHLAGSPCRCGYDH